MYWKFCLVFLHQILPLDLEEKQTKLLITNANLDTKEINSIQKEYLVTFMLIMVLMRLNIEEHCIFMLFFMEVLHLKFWIQLVVWNLFAALFLRFLMKCTKQNYHQKFIYFIYSKITDVLMQTSMKN